MENETTTADTTEGAPSHPDCLHCQLSAAFREMAHGGPYAEVAFLEKRKEMLGY